MNLYETSISANMRPRILRNRFVHVKRVILGLGKILVKTGTEVQPEDVIGRSNFTPGFFAINIAQKLGVRPSEGLKFLQRPLGKAIYTGELLAFKKNFLGKKVVTSPTDGLIEFYDAKTGDLRLKYLPKEVPLASGVYGCVDYVDPIKGEVLIKAMVTEVLGVFGSGKERNGLLRVLSLDGLVQKDQINDEGRQHVLVVGSVLYADVLKKAVGYGVTGIITGGINARDFKSMGVSIDPRRRIGSDIGVSVVATEGFGHSPIGEDLANVFKEYEGKFVFINGNISQIILPSNSSDSILALRKIYLPVTRAPIVPPEVSLGGVSVGTQIRIIWPPYFGAHGKVVAVDKTVTVLESGIATFLLTVETPKQKIKVPYPNVEII